MKIVKLAAGFAIGYVLGSRAGRDTYQKIVANTQQLREHPTVQQAKSLLAGSADKATAKLHQAAIDLEPTPAPTPASVRPKPRPRTNGAPLDPAAAKPLS
ncbi:hypothetical protein KOI35_31485 [Actinoplanes bogorensis]|uniref:Protoporphyrinogen oxidase n=1 Tax=Paractinoplanes bogorensis TaxID=1610840 RepID=A0ABS5YZA8_9ACTN|nr:hypothetical protein [Actinoplanes bogorensis]MBU2668043.1 hypothetical protein [Actinoplanes bogorensis]